MSGDAKKPKDEKHEIEVWIDMADGLGFVS